MCNVFYIKTNTFFVAVFLWRKFIVCYSIYTLILRIELKFVNGGSNSGFNIEARAHLLLFLNTNHSYSTASHEKSWIYMFLLFVCNAELSMGS